MKVTLKKRFKNHPPGTQLDVSKGIYDDLKRMKVIAAPVVLKVKSDRKKKGGTHGRDRHES